jgi:hypothetical protein
LFSLTLCRIALTIYLTAASASASVANAAAATLAGYCAIGRFARAAAVQPGGCFRSHSLRGGERRPRGPLQLSRALTSVGNGTAIVIVIVIFIAVGTGIGISTGIGTGIGIGIGIGTGITSIAVTVAFPGCGGAAVEPSCALLLLLLLLPLLLLLLLLLLLVRGVRHQRAFVREADGKTRLLRTEHWRRRGRRAGPGLGGE